MYQELFIIEGKYIGFLKYQQISMTFQYFLISLHITITYKQSNKMDIVKGC